MNGTGCENVRDRIPEWVRGELDASARAEVDLHLEACAACRDEAELAALLLAARPVVPGDLAIRIKAVVRAPRRPSGRPWWGLAAAAVAAVALGIGVHARSGTADTELPAYVAGTDTEEMWLSDDGLIAGAPALDGLSDDALATLLKEMTPGGQA